MNARNFFAMAPLVLLLAACSGGAASTKRDNVAYLYSRAAGTIQMDARIHHLSATQSRLYYKLPTRDLLYKSTGAGSPFRASVRLTYELFADWSSRTVLDSASILVQDQTTDPAINQEIIGHMLLRPSERKSYVLRLSARDLNRESQSVVIFRVDRDPKDPRQFFLPLDPGTGQPLFGDHWAEGTGAVHVEAPYFKGTSLNGRFFQSPQELPAPVFAPNPETRRNREADSTFTVQVDPEGKLIMALGRMGAYHLCPDATDPRGYTLFALASGYPFVGTPGDMLRPLRYITSMQEYDRMSKASNIRQAIERFWLDSAGDRDRAREAIRIYYGRVENANRHFTGEVEGWRTDRGLVHLIFGVPSTIYRSEQGETWTFGEENNLLSLSFTFVKRDNPLTGNDMVLERDPLLKGAWYRNVESWRNGRVYQN